MSSYADGGESAFAYDAAGNRIAGPDGPAVFDRCNRLLTQGDTRYRYDARGALVERHGPAGHWRFAYNDFGQLVAAQDGHGRRLSFGYDPLGRRLWKRASADGVETLTRFVWAGEQLIREERESGADIWGMAGGSVVRDYLYWPHSHIPLLLRDQGMVYRYHTDSTGVPQRLTAAGGEVVWEAAHDAYGRAREHVAQVAQPLRLPGQYADDEFGFGLHYNRFRYYDPAAGRYISRDPVGMAGGLNLYLYVGNDPVNRADPLGLWWKTALAVVGAIAVGALVVLAAPIVLPMIGIAAGTMAATAITTVAAGALAGAAFGGLNEGLNQETFCLSCILKAMGTGALVGALASVPFIFLPAAAGVAAFLGVGGLSGFIGYAVDTALNGREWSWKDAAVATGIGAITAGTGRYIAGRFFPAARPGAVAADDAAAASSAGGAKGPAEPYNRAAHYGRTPTAADRKAVGAGPEQVADHDPPLVQRYYEGDPARGEKPGWQMTPAERAASGSDRTRMSPQPRADSDSQGGKMSAYSREMKRKHGL